MDRRIVEITINDSGNIEFSVYNEEIKKLNDGQFNKVISNLNTLKRQVSVARELTKVD